MKAQFGSKRQLPSETCLSIPLHITTFLQGVLAMVRSFVAVSALVAFAAPAAAASYSAKLAAPTNQRIIARDISWQCGTDACQGSTAESRPVVLCESLAKRAGKVDSFLVDGRAFSQAELAQCNASAKAASGKALAAQ
jgi:hypothetical protein